MDGSRFRICSYVCSYITQLSSIRVYSLLETRCSCVSAAIPALTIFFNRVPYDDDPELHETFWSSHLNRVASAGILLGAKAEGEWTGFRCFFKPGQGRYAYSPDYVSAWTAPHVFLLSIIACLDSRLQGFSSCDVAVDFRARWESRLGSVPVTCWKG